MYRVVSRKTGLACRVSLHGVGILEVPVEFDNEADAQTYADALGVDYGLEYIEPLTATQSQDKWDWVNIGIGVALLIFWIFCIAWLASQW